MSNQHSVLELLAELQAKLDALDLKVSEIHAQYVADRKNVR